MATQLNVATRPGVLFRTTNATPVVAVNFPTRPSKVYWIDVKVTAAYSDTSAGAIYWLAGAFRTNAAGTLTQISTTASVITAKEDTGSMDATMAASGTNVQVTVTGVAVTNIQWRVNADIEEDDFINVN